MKRKSERKSAHLKLLPNVGTRICCIATLPASNPMQSGFPFSSPSPPNNLERRRRRPSCISQPESSSRRPIASLVIDATSPSLTSSGLRARSTVEGPAQALGWACGLNYLARNGTFCTRHHPAGALAPALMLSLIDLTTGS